jgi:acyl carrier protein
MNETELIEIVRTRFLGGDSSFPIAADTKLLDEGVCDSLGLVQLAVEVESRCAGLRIPDQDITREHFGSVNAILNYIESRQEA